MRTTVAATALCVLVSSTAEAITNGADDADHAGVVAIAPCEEDVATCTGILVAPNVVLTAAHCVERHSGYRVLIGSTTAHAVAFDAVAIHTHPSYEDGAVASDLAFVYLASPIESDVAEPMLLAEDLPDADSRVTIVGFGRTSADAADFGAKRTGTALVSEVGDGVLTLLPDPSLPCDVDSGGPVLGSVDGVESVVGVLAAGDFACREWGSAGSISDARSAFIDPGIGSQELAQEIPRCTHDPPVDPDGGSEDSGCMISRAPPLTHQVILPLLASLCAMAAFRRLRGKMDARLPPS